MTCKLHQKLPDLDMTGKRKPWNIYLLGSANYLVCPVLIIPLEKKRKENIFEDTVNPGSTQLSFIFHEKKGKVYFCS